MAWTVLDEAKVLADCPTDLRPDYDQWLVDYPDKAGRLAEITGGIVAEFRDAIASNPENLLNENPAALPESCIRHAEILIYGTLSMEMGRELPPDERQSMTQSEMFLRQIAYEHFLTDSQAKEEPTPYYRTGIEHKERALP